MRNRVFLLSVLMLIAVSSADFCPPTPSPCVGCEDIGGALSSDITLVRDDFSHTATASLYFENISATGPPRQAINFTTLIVNVYNESPDEGDVYRVYTDANGSATFDFSAYSDRCVTIGFLYCPFTCPESPECGFQECMNFSGINCPPCNASAVTEANSPTGPLKCYKLLPSYRTTEYCPPPKPLTSTPEICFPLVLIFAILAGALFLSGVNPFTGFDFSAPRLGRHIIYQPRGRGVSLDFLQAAKISIGAVREKKRMRTGQTRKESTGDRRWFWQPPKGRATVKPLEKAKAKAVGEAFKKMPQYKGIGGYFRQIGAGLTMIGLSFISSSFIGTILSTLGIDVSKAPIIGFLKKLAVVFPEPKQLAVAEYHALQKGLKDLNIGKAGFNLVRDEKTGQLMVRGPDGKMKPLTVTLSGGRKVQVFSMQPLVEGAPIDFSTFTGVLKTADKKGNPFEVTVVNGQFKSYKSGDVNFEMRKGVLVPVSIEAGGKTYELHGAQDVFRFQGPDKKDYIASLEEGKLKISNLKTGEVIESPMKQFGLEFAGSIAIAMTQKDFPPMTKSDIAEITKGIQNQATHSITLNTTEAKAMFGNNSTTVNSNLGNAENTSFRQIDDKGNQFIMGGGKITAEGDVNGTKIQAAYGRDGKPLQVDSKTGKYVGTNVTPGQNADAVVNQYRDAREYLTELHGKCQIYKQTMMESVPKMLEKRPDITIAEQGIATTNTGSAKSDRAQIKTFVSAFAWNDKPTYDHLTKGLKTEAEKSKAIEKYVKSTVDDFMKIPQVFRGYGARDILASRGDPHYQYVTSMPDRLKTPDYGAMAGVKFADPGKPSQVSVSSKEATLLAGLAETNAVTAAMALKYGASKDLNEMYRAAITYDKNIRQTIADTINKKITGAVRISEKERLAEEREKERAGEPQPESLKQVLKKRPPPA